MRRLYYFTTINTLKKIIASNGIKPSTINSVNDPYEIRARRSYRRKTELVSLDTPKNSFQFGFVCFSDNYSNPVMWGNYADKHKGCCLSIDVKKEKLVKIAYVRNLLTFKCNRDLTEKDCLRILSRKYIRWSYEREYRMFTKDEKEFFSDEFVLNEVLLGYKSDENIEDYLLQNGIKFSGVTLDINAYKIIKK